MTEYSRWDAPIGVLGDDSINVVDTPGQTPNQPQWEQGTVLPFAHRTSPDQTVMGTDESGRMQPFTPPSYRFDVPEAVTGLINAGKNLYGHARDVLTGKVQTHELPGIAPEVNKDVAELSQFLVAPEGSAAAGGGIKSLEALIGKTLGQTVGKFGTEVALTPEEEAAFAAVEKEAEEMMRQQVAHKFEIEEEMGGRPLHETFSNLPAVRTQVLKDVEAFTEDHAQQLPNGEEKWISAAEEAKSVYENVLSSGNARDAAKAYGLSFHETASVYYYTRHGNEFINEALRYSSTNPKAAHYEKVLNQTLDKLPMQKPSTVFRATYLDEAQWANYPAVGEEFIDPAFVSTTKTEDIAFSFLHSGDMDWFAEDRLPVLFKIKNTTGRYIADLSHFPRELETLLKSGRRFRVDEKSVSKGGNHIIGLTEIPEPKAVGQMELPFPKPGKP